MDEYISKQSVIDYLKGYLNSIGECGADSLLFDRGQRRALINSIQDISVIKGADVQPVKHGQWIDHEKLIGIFGTLCDHMVDNGRCDVFCPYAKTKDKDDECEAWRTIQKIRGEAENETE